MTRFTILAAAGYLLLLASLLFGVFQWRRTSLSAATPELRQRDWERWRAEVERQADADAPVRRRVPGSPEPPSTVLVRDYFGVVVTGTIVLTSLVFWASLYFIRGVLFGPKFEVQLKDEE